MTEPSDYDHNTTLGEGTKRRNQQPLNSNSRVPGASPDSDAPSLPTVDLTTVFPIFPTQATSHPCPRYSSSHPFLSQQPHIATALSLSRLFLRRPPIFLSSLPPQPAISAISLPSLATRTKSRHRSPTAPAFCSQPLPPTAAPAALTSSDAPAPPPASPFLPPQSHPKPSPTLPPSSSFAFSSLCHSRLYHSPRRTLLPPSSLPSCFYRSQALLCRSLDLLFFITAEQSLPSSLAATTTPLCNAYTLLCRCSHRNLLLSRALLYHRGTLVPSSFPIAVITPKHRRCPSSVPPLRCLLLSALLTTPLPPPLPLLPSPPQPLSTTPLPLHLLAATSLPLLHLAATAAPPCCQHLQQEGTPPVPLQLLPYLLVATVASSHTNSLCSNCCPSPTTQTHAPDSTAKKRTEHH
ncbi:hypothetical protein BHM03_00021668 [Ensete ventricosum]|nr:hypothetical protein BHM03_00021668 [Ensete ventricosum]